MHMSKKKCENYYSVDHANKLADRERQNPNRARRRLMRALLEMKRDFEMDSSRLAPKSTVDNE